MKFCDRIFLLMGLLSSIGSCLNAQANVSLKNGNFFIAYTDVVYTGGYETRLQRVYNSKSSFKGNFGWGWGNEFEVRLAVAADGSVVVHEYGGGAENRFNPLTFRAAELDAAIESLVRVAQGEGVLGSAAQLAAYKSRLKNDPTFRNQEWEVYRSRGKLQARQLPVGTQLQSSRFSYQFITRTADGYVRTLVDSGQSEKFDNAGRLLKASDRNGNFVTFEYGPDGHLRKLLDNFNRKLFFEYNSRGLVAKVEGENGKVATYQYNADDELVQSKDVDGNAYRFKYDSQKRHNLTEISYQDRSALKISYFGLDRQENVQRVINRDGTEVDYDYGLASGSNGVTSVSVVTRKAGKILSQSKYQYVIKRKASGEEWTYQLITDFDGDRTETTYNECCGLPVVIKQGGDQTTFDYDAKGHVLKKATPSEVTELRYDSGSNKVSSVVKYYKNKPENKKYSEFRYDSSGNLVFAKNSDSKVIRLAYDNLGRIKTILDQNGDELRFKYNEASRPIEISDPKLGSIIVSYTNSGDVKEVSSQAGPSVAAKVSASFQELLDIVKPAGVSLAF